MKFIDYHFDVTPDGTIIMDKELTLDNIKSNVGDLYIVMFEEGGVRLVPCDTNDDDEFYDEEYADMSLAFIVNNNKD